MGYNLKNYAKSLAEETNYQRTENFALGYSTTFNPIVDMNYKVPSYRNEPSDLRLDFIQALGYDTIYAIRFLFFLRDVRGGLGERNSFRVIYGMMAEKPRYREMARNIMPLVPHFGRWDDLFSLFNTPLEGEMIEYISSQLNKDLNALAKGENVSLLAKWMPSEQASSAVTKGMAHRFMKKLALSPRMYRQMLSALRKEIDIVERKIGENRWSEVDYSKVPSKANLRYTKAFLRHDGERREAFIERALKGEEKVNAGAVFPHEIAMQLHTREWNPHELTEAQISSLEAQWKNLPDLMKSANSSTIVVQDGSGSMLVPVGRGGNARALDVAVALAVYCAERLEGPFKNKSITFSQNPKFIDYSHFDSSMDKILASYQYLEVSNTNIEAVFDLLLKTAIKNGLKPEKMVKNVLIISDMEFDEARGQWRRAHDEDKKEHTLFKIIGKKFKKAGYPMPRLIFWNVNSRSNTIPEYKSNTVLMGGFSPNALKTAFNLGKDPWDALKKTLDSPRYAQITEYNLGRATYGPLDFSDYTDL